MELGDVDTIGGDGPNPMGTGLKFVGTCIMLGEVKEGVGCDSNEEAPLCCVFERVGAVCVVFCGDRIGINPNTGGGDEEGMLDGAERTGPNPDEGA